MSTASKNISGKLSFLLNNYTKVLAVEQQLKDLFLAESGEEAKHPEPISIRFSDAFSK